MENANGNTVSKSEGSNFWRYVWDYENRLATASTRKQTVRYTFDALGRRVVRSLAYGKELTKFTYDGLDVLVDDNFGTQTKYLNGSGIDNKLRATTGSTASYFLTDHLGSTNGLANSSGALTASNSFDSFGNPTNTAFPSRYQFTGREFDNFSGLQFSRARFYDPNIGRFISEDPIGFGGNDVNFYAYVKNRPMMYRDPDGLFPILPPLITLSNRDSARKLDGFNPVLGGEVGAGVHILPLPGPKGSVGLELNPLTGETCFYVKGTARFGFGYYAGAGAQAGLSFGPYSRGTSISPSVDVGGDIAVPEGIRGKVSSGIGGSAGLDGLGVGLGPSIGVGASAGVDVGAKYYFKCFLTPKCK